MHDGVGAAIGTFIAWFGLLGLAALTKGIINLAKEKCSTEIGNSAEHTKMMTRKSHYKYSIEWSDLQNEGN